jgi:Cys-tRNA(Pro)/Cys-tRNA(Cys) deacylase
VSKLPKTNAARFLDDLGITYELRPYDVDDEDLTATTVAAKVGLAPEQVYKTLCMRGDKTGPLFAIVSALQEVDLKALARVSGNRKVEPVPLKELTALTGYIRGGTTVFAAKKALPVFVDELIELCDHIAVSAGQRGLQLVLTPAHYINAADATLGPIGRFL